MGVINAVAQFERDLLIERTQAGLARTKAEGTTLGRPVLLDVGKREAVRAELAGGASVAALARRLGVSRQTIQRVRDMRAQGVPNRVIVNTLAHVDKVRVSEDKIQDML